MSRQRRLIPVHGPRERQSRRFGHPKPSCLTYAIKLVDEWNRRGSVPMTQCLVNDSGLVEHRCCKLAVEKCRSGPKDQASGPLRNAMTAVSPHCGRMVFAPKRARADTAAHIASENERVASTATSFSGQEAASGSAIKSST